MNRPFFFCVLAVHELQFSSQQILSEVIEMKTLEMIESFKDQVERELLAEETETVEEAAGMLRSILNNIHDDSIMGLEINLYRALVYVKERHKQHIVAGRMIQKLRAPQKKDNSCPRCR